MSVNTVTRSCPSPDVVSRYQIYKIQSVTKYCISKTFNDMKINIGTRYKPQ